MQALGLEGRPQRRTRGALPAFTGGDRAGRELTDTEEQGVAEMQTGVLGFHTHACAEMCAVT